MAGARRQLPNRRASITEEITVDGRKYFVTIGFADEDGRAVPREVFIRDKKEGSTMSRILDDASIAISLALQFGVKPSNLAHSVTRLPTGPVAPSDLDRPEGGVHREPASAIGAAIDLLADMDDGAGAEAA